MSNVGVICEQGDMGLHFDPLKEADQRRYEEQQKEAKNKEEANKNKNR